MEHRLHFSLRVKLKYFGVPSKPDTIAAVIDADPGRFGLYQYPQFRYAFKRQRAK
jgi:hypothetical protein